MSLKFRKTQHTRTMCFTKSIGNSLVWVASSTTRCVAWCWITHHCAHNDAGSKAIIITSRSWLIMTSRSWLIMRRWSASPFSRCFYPLSVAFSLIIHGQKHFQSTSPFTSCSCRSNSAPGEQMAPFSSRTYGNLGMPCCDLANPLCSVLFQLRISRRLSRVSVYNYAPWMDLAER